MTQPTDHSIVRQERLLDPPRAACKTTRARARARRLPADHSFHNPMHRPRLFAVPTY